MDQVDRVGTRDVVDQSQLIARDQRCRISNRRIVGDAALEVMLGVVALLDFAHHVEAGGGAVSLLARGICDVLRHLGDHADQ